MDAYQQPPRPGPRPPRWAGAPARGVHPVPVRPAFPVRAVRPVPPTRALRPAPPVHRTASTPPWQFDLLVSPDVPEPDRTTLYRMRAQLNARFEKRSRSVREPLPPPVVFAVVPATAAVAGAWGGPELGAVYHLLFDPAARPDPLAWAVSLALTGLGVGCFTAIELIHRYHRRRLAEQWSEYVIPDARQRAAAAFPGVGERLAQLAHHVRKLRQHPSVRGGWLPGVDGEALDRVHFTLAGELLNTVDLRAAVLAAANRPVLAAQVAARTAELAAGDAAFDAQLRHLTALVASADTIATRLTDLALAERLDAGTPSTARVRERLAVHIAVDLVGMAAAADEAVRIVGEALDPRRLYPARDPLWRLAHEPPAGS